MPDDVASLVEVLLGKDDDSEHEELTVDKCDDGNLASVEGIITLYDF